MQTQQADETTDNDSGIVIEEVSADSAQTGDASTGDDAEVVISIGDPPPHDDDEDEGVEETPAIKKLRERHRELAKEAREARAERDALKAQMAPVVTQPTLRAKPKPEDFDFDDDKYEGELLKWHDEKRKADAAAAESNKRAEDEVKALQAKHASYKQRGASLKVPDAAVPFVEAEDVVKKGLSLLQQDILLAGAEDPAALVYAIGTNGEELKKLAAISNPVAFAAAVGRLESKVKVSQRKPSTTPEKPLGGGRAPATSVDSTRDRLEKDAEKSGDMTALFAYDRAQARKKR